MIGLAGLLLVGGCGSGSGPTTASTKPSASPEPSYGELPSFLPSSSTESDSELTGSAEHPALTTEGDAVNVRLPAATVHVRVTGPEVPGEGLPYQSPATACTWTVTLSGASAEVPIRVADFTSLDHLGNVYHPKLVAGQPVPPTTLAPGQQVSFELRARMTVGEGLMRWAPGERHAILAAWDFEVETD